MRFDHHKTLSADNLGQTFCQVSENDVDITGMT